MEQTKLSYDLAKESLIRKDRSVKLKGIAIETAQSSNELLKRYRLFLLGCICTKDEGCTCDYFKIIWILSDDIYSEKKTGEKTEEGYDIVDIEVRNDAMIITEKTETTKAFMLNAKIKDLPFPIRNSVARERSSEGPNTCKAVRAMVEYVAFLLKTDMYYGDNTLAGNVEFMVAFYELMHQERIACR